MRRAGLIKRVERIVLAMKAKTSRVALPCFMRSCRGATAVEMALIAPVFFMLLTGITEMTMMMTAQQLLESATYNTSRLAKTGYVESGKSQLETVSQVLNKQLESLGSFIDMTHVTMTAKAYETFAGIGSGEGSEGLGTPEQIVVYTVTYPWKFLTPMIGELIGTQDTGGNWVVNLQSQIVVRNEPYS
ncbi:MAG: TadE/TadG family type IV pilus assembly protein [Bdellovibrionales bacterium]